MADARRCLKRVPGLREWTCDLATGPLMELVVSNFAFEALVDTSTWRVACVAVPAKPLKNARS